MNEVRLSWHDYRYFPYEQELARREIEAVLGVPPQDRAGGLTVPLNGHSPELVKRLTYVRSVMFPDDRVVLTNQALLEDSARRGADGPAGKGSGRQSTRYSAHGLHEYRGKFHPQIVRATGNLLGLREGHWVIDPFCGSGTTLTEGAHCGWNCVGVDMNPLAILISNAKVQALNVPSAVLEREAAAVTKELERRVGNVSFTSQWDDSTAVQVAGSNWRHALVNETYLSTWFPAPVLAQLVAILRTIERHEAIGDILRVVLSDLVRRVSYQDPGDLRIRRRKDAEANYPAIPLFVASLNKKLSMVVRAQQVAAVSGRQIAVGGDSREPLQAQLAAEIDSDLTFDAGVTSPPYATALPYIDTQRLSLALLGLIGSADIAALDERLIGTREVKKLRRVQFEDSIATDETIASEVRDLCLSMLQSVKSSSSDGFRRHNTPALVYQYFRDMGKVLDNVREVIKPNGAFVMIVGRNRSTLGGNDYVVDTPRLLQETALVRGWYRAGSLELDTYPRYDLHQRNSIRTETMLILRRQE